MTRTPSPAECVAVYVAHDSWGKPIKFRVGGYEHGDRAIIRKEDLSRPYWRLPNQSDKARWAFKKTQDKLRAK